MEQLIAALAPFVFAQRQRFENRQDVLLDRHLAKDRFFLRQIAHAEPGALVHGIIRHVRPGENDAAAVWPDEPDDHVKARRLAGAVRAEQAHDLAGAHLDIDPVNHGAPAVHFHELLRGQDVFLLRPAWWRA